MTTILRTLAVVALLINVLANFQPAHRRGLRRSRSGGEHRALGRRNAADRTGDLQIRDGDLPLEERQLGAFSDSSAAAYRRVLRHGSDWNPGPVGTQTPSPHYS